MIIECTTAEQTQFKQNIKINDTDTAIIFTQENKPEDMTCGEYLLSLVKWRIEDNGNVATATASRLAVRG